jgi:hypothetical protein
VTINLQYAKNDPAVPHQTILTKSGQQIGGTEMFGRLAAARPIQKPLAEIEPRFHHIASVSEIIARDFVSVSAASRNKQDLERPKNRSAVDGAILSLIPFAVVAFVVIGVLYGAGFWMILTSRENIAAQRVGESKATVISLEQTVLPRQVTATPPPTPTPLPSEATLTPLAAQAHPMDKAASVLPPGPIVPPAAAPPIRPQQTAVSEAVVQNGSVLPATISASPATKVLPENSRKKPPAARIRFLRDQVARTERQLTRPNLSAAETKRLERQKAYWGRALEQASGIP